jgi:hypothetical protein
MQVRRSNTPIVIAVLHLIYLGYYLYLLVASFRALTDMGIAEIGFEGVVDLIVVCVGVVAIPIAAVFLFMRKRIGYYITMGFSVLGIIAALLLFIQICSLVTEYHAPFSYLVGAGLGLVVRYLYPIIAVNILRPRIKIDLD